MVFILWPMGGDSGMNGFVDLFSGLMGASSGFLNRPDWEVLTVENNPLLHAHQREVRARASNVCHLHQDITQWHDTVDFINNWIEACYIDRLVVWASPPCYEFSNAYSAPRPTALREGREWEPSMECLEATLAIIHHLPVDVYVIENVAGAVKYFTPKLGEFRQHIGPFFLWGNFPLIDIGPNYKHTKPDKRHSPIRANIRAEIPEKISHAFRECLEQPTLDDF